MKKILVTVGAAAAIVLPAAPAPAATSLPDCSFSGPHWGYEVTDCVNYIYANAIG